MMLRKTSIALGTAITALVGLSVADSASARGYLDGSYYFGSGVEAPFSSIALFNRAKACREQHFDRPIVTCAERPPWVAVECAMAVAWAVAA
jgi:hypothetical protein